MRFVDIRWDQVQEAPRWHRRRSEPPPRSRLNTVRSRDCCRLATVRLFWSLAAGNRLQAMLALQVLRYRLRSASALRLERQNRGLKALLQRLCHEVRVLRLPRQYCRFQRWPPRRIRHTCTGQPERVTLAGMAMTKAGFLERRLVGRATGRTGFALNEPSTSHCSGFLLWMPPE